MRRAVNVDVAKEYDDIACYISISVNTAEKAHSIVDGMICRGRDIGAELDGVVIGMGPHGRNGRDGHKQAEDKRTKLHSPLLRRSIRKGDLRSSLTI